MKTTKDYIITENPNPNYYGQDQYYIYKRDNFSLMPSCKTFDNNGCMLCHNECCGDDEDHYEVFAYNYWDGSNWKTIIIGDIDEGGQPEINDIEADKILSEMPDYPYIDSIAKSIETENYTFNYTRYASAEICTVD